MPAVLAKADEGISASHHCTSSARRANVALEDASKDREKKREELIFFFSTLSAFSQRMSRVGSMFREVPEGYHWMEDLCCNREGLLTWQRKAIRARTNALRQ